MGQKNDVDVALPEFAYEALASRLRKKTLLTRIIPDATTITGCKVRYVSK